ncbi:hypothetical protein N7478_002027 [Penicillium angulare]|uniref:uncharacterized protein n=1 Tax=Penicillium angulare TaxID=116970 RepID=UPI00253F89DF|nr:uncharacterized protein N7478_002027 [Penicillium angulare]KAJ5288997.1 hypothetical protein N7478_002027 [Penicillium angulare]
MGSTTVTITEKLRSSPSPQIIDIRSESLEGSLTESLQYSIHRLRQEKPSLPNLLLWNEKGLRYFEQITYLTDYYLTNDEIEILRRSCQEIASHIPSGSMLVELGSGNLRKIKLLLDALDHQEKEVDYFALDLSEEELQRTLSLLPKNCFTHVRCFGLLGTYDDGKKWLTRPELKERPKTIVSLGSTIGSMSREEAADFLSSFTWQLGEGTRSPAFLLGLDGCTDGKRVYDAYNDPGGLNYEFIRNGLFKANDLLGYEAFKLDDWEIKGEWNDNQRSHDQYYYALKDTKVGGQNLPAKTKVLAVQSYKYDDDDKCNLWEKSRLVEAERWTSSSSEYCIHILRAQ